MPSTYSPNFNLELQATGENADVWGQHLNNNVFSILDAALGNTLSLPLTNTNVTLNTAQSQNNFIDLSGTLTGNVSIIFPQIGRTYFVRNGTTGAFSVTLKTSAVGGATYVLQQGQARYITLNGTDVLVGFDGSFGALTNIASAATTDIGTVATRNVNITGTTAITSLGSSASIATPLYQVTFAGALTLTYNATSLITPSAGNIYTAAGDTAMLQYLGSGNWQVLSYQANTYIPGTQPIAGGFRNLRVTVTSTSAVSITADALTVEDSLGRAYRARSVNLSASLAVSGANGLDTGSEAASTWYSVWVIYNQTTNTLAALLSTSGTSPNLPAGYTFQARFGWIRNDASSNLWFTRQYGRRSQIVVGTNPTSLPQMGTTSTNAWVALSVSNFVPPTASSIKVSNYVVPAGFCGIAPNNSFSTNLSSTSNPTPFASGSGAGSGAINPFADIGLESTNIYVISGNPATFWCFGWEDNL